MIDQLRVVTPRSEIILEEVPAPQKLATFAFAFTADVSNGLLGDAEEEMQPAQHLRMVGEAARIANQRNRGEQADEQHQMKIAEKLVHGVPLQLRPLR